MPKSIRRRPNREQHHMNWKILAALLVGAVFSLPVEARHKPVNACIETGNIMQPCAYQPNFLSGIRSIKVRMHRERHSAIQRVPEGRETASQVIGGRPAGCPHAFCGCSASLKVFGRIIPALNLAANWRRFPPSAPAPGMVAWRAHHVFVILAVNSDGTVVAHDGNSGRHLTRVHTVSLRGYRVVNPHG